MVRSRRRKKYFWTPYGTGTTSLAASGAVAVDLTSILYANYPSSRDFTLVRLRGLMGCRPASNFTNLNTYNIGIVVVTLQAFQASAGTPDPEDDEASWLYQKTVVWTPNLMAETAAGVFAAGYMMFEIDARAMRKLPAAEQRVVFRIKNRQAVTSEFFIEGVALLDLK